MINVRRANPALIFVLLLAVILTGCNAEAAEEAEQTQTDRENTAYVVYEAIFLDNGEILGIFEEIRGDAAPYEKVTSDFHVTTAYMPESDNRRLYGAEVTIHITGYKCGAVTMDDGQETENEGLCVTISTEDAELSEYLAGLDNNWHITGSYKDAAKYTGYIDFSDAESVDYTVTGTYGAFLNGGKISFSAQDVDAPLQ